MRESTIDGTSKAAQDLKTRATEPGQARLVNVKQAGSYLGVSPWTIREMVWRGEIPEIRIGRRLLFDLRDLDRLIERCKQHRGGG